MDIRTYSTTVVSILASKETKELRADLDNARTAAATWKRAAKMLWRCERDAVQMYEREKAERERVEGELMRRIQQLIDANKLNERLTHDLADAQTVAILQRELHAAELGQCASENNQLTENAAELGKALDMALAERDEAYRDLDAQTLKANSFMRELHRYMQHGTELKDMLDASVTERDALRADLNNERNAHNATAAQLYAELAGAQDAATAAVQAWRTVTAERDALRAELDAQAKRHADVIERWKVEENTWCEFDKEQLTQIAALRAELDAMRQAHSVVAARMAAMGC